MARLNRRNFQDTRSDEKSKLKDIKQPVVIVESLSPEQLKKLRSHKIVQQEKSVVSFKQPTRASTRSRTDALSSSNKRKQDAPSENIVFHLEIHKESHQDLSKSKENEGVSVTKRMTKKSPAKTDSVDSNIHGKCDLNDKSKNRKEATDLNFDETDTLPQKKLLRKRKLLDYRERSSLDSNTSQQTNGNVKVPIYRKYMKENTEKTNQRDPFTFTPDSDEDKNSDVSFRINSPKKRKIIHLKQTKPLINTQKCKKQINMKYNDKINKTLNLISSKFNLKKSETTSNNNKTRENTKLQKEVSKSDALIFNSTQIPNVHLSTLGESFNDSSIRDNTAMDAEKTDRCPDIQSFDSTEIGRAVSDVGSVRSFSICNEDNIDNSNHNGTGSTTNKQSGRINIIQNCVLDTSSLCLSKNLQPSKGSWRFESDILTRNPHFISLNNNGIPILNQDSIVDHTFDDRIGEVNHTVLIPETKNSPKQQSILNYIPTSKEYSKQTYQRASLYDIDELSPLKSSHKNKENSRENRNQEPNQKGKRNILGQLNCNILTIRNQTSTPHKNVALNRPQFDVSNIVHENSEPKKQIEIDLNFSSDNVENNETRKKPEEKPFRLEVNLKHYKSKKGPEMITRPIRDSEVERIIEKDPGFDDLLENDNLEIEKVGLFEDVEVPANITKTYKPRTKKTISSIHQSPKKKRPPKLNKEALKWIKEFNQMCAEVDKVELELE